VDYVVSPTAHTQKQSHASDNEICHTGIFGGTNICHTGIFRRLRKYNTVTVTVA